METTWTKADYRLPRDYVRQKLAQLEGYRRVCDYQGMTPLRGTVAEMARHLRQYRFDHKFYDCV